MHDPISGNAAMSVLKSVLPQTSTAHPLFSSPLISFLLYSFASGIFPHSLFTLSPSFPPFFRSILALVRQQPSKDTETLRCQPLLSACNPSYSGGRDQEDHGSKPAQENSSWDPISKKPNTKNGWWSGSRCRPWVQTHKKMSIFSSWSLFSIFSHIPYICLFSYIFSFVFFNSLLLFTAVLGVEPRALCLLSKHTTTLYSHFIPEPAWTESLFVIPT
jgi:hypothetical protein